ncbi:hypothetical protein SSX86_016528 [Deinandra increscens subsp. villosa]|uniref:RING-type E3 ubiquitin transferase n=1 Tax=Deinandra increscens subsp. villosa TaxID=3103831 RepID=A0AAP0H053_9ASTR
MIHQSSSDSPTFPFIAVAIIGIFATIFLLLFYYIFIIKCCRIDILRRTFSLSVTTDHLPLVPEQTGLHESVIRSIPIFHFRKQKHPYHDNECAVCLGEFEDDEKLRIIPKCAHVFHIDCIDVWLQNNPNCPLCRNSISISMNIDPLPQTPRDEQDFVVIELHDDNHARGRPNSSEPPPRRMMERLRKRYGNDHSSMGDECVGVSTTPAKGTAEGEDRFLIRRSFSMDSASDRQLYLAVQEIRNSLNHVDATEMNVNNISDDSTRLGGRCLFSFGHARSAVLPFHHLDRKTSI